MQLGGQVECKRVVKWVSFQPVGWGSFASVLTDTEDGSGDVIVDLPPELLAKMG